MTASTAARNHCSNATRRARWDECQALREQVRDDLYEWGGAQRGGAVNLGFYSEQVFCRSPRQGRPPHNPDKVDAITDAMTLWRLIGEMAGGWAQVEVRRRHSILIRYFVHQGPVARMAKAEGISRQHFYRLLGEAMFTFWVLYYLPSERAPMGVDKSM